MSRGSRPFRPLGALNTKRLISKKILQSIDYAGGVNVKNIFGYVKEGTHGLLNRWSKRVYEILSAESLEAFLMALGCVDFEEMEEAQQTNMQWTDDVWRDHLEQLTREKVFQEVYEGSHLLGDRLEGKQWKCSVRYFSVPKGNSGLARAIASCRLWNRRIPKAPNFSLVDHPTLLDLLAQFTSPSMATCDYKNHFYQIPLPPGAQGVFNVYFKQGSRGRKRYAMTVLPMGFSWSPFIAQTLTSIVMYRARHEWLTSKCRRAPGPDAKPPDVPDGVFEDVILVHDKQDKLVAFMTAVYDNILVVAENQAIRRELQTRVDAANRDFNLKVKPQKGADKGGWFTTDDFKEDIKASSVVFLGIEYIVKCKGSPSDMPGLSFRHAADNVAAWTTEFEETMADATDRGYLTNRDISELLGVLIWDCRVFLQPLSVIADQMDLLSRIGKQMAGTTKDTWDAKASVFADLAEAEKPLLSVYRKFLARAKSEAPSAVPDRIVKEKRSFLCSDSSFERAAGVELSTSGGKVTVQFNWRDIRQPVDTTDNDPRVELPPAERSAGISQQERGKRNRTESTPASLPTLIRSINWKETSVAIDTIEKFLEGKSEDELSNLEIVFGEDNTTAMTALNNFYYPKCTYLSGRLFTLFEKLKGATLTTFYVPTAKQPADEPSRKALFAPSPEWHVKCCAVRSALEEQYERRGGQVRKIRKLL